MRLANRWLPAGICAGWLVGAGVASRPAEPARAAAASLAEMPTTTNVHHQTQYCGLCHQMGLRGPIVSQVRFGVDYAAGCRCHYRARNDLRHPTDVAVPQAMRARVPTGFPLQQDRLTCVTCHSFAVLCAVEPPPRSSLRGAPYPDRSAFCFRCHEAQPYTRLNPHQQLDAAGRIVAGKCLFCHTQRPEEGHATFASIKLVGAVEMLCQGCHNVSDRHPAGRPHFVRPPLEYQVRMRSLEREFRMVLPLDEQGKLTCITCHNPHEPGVIPRSRPGASGAGEKLRHGPPRVFCAECHWRPLSSEDR